MNLPIGSLRDLRDHIGLKGPISIDPLTGGRNNRIFRLCGNGQTFLLKAYFHHPIDERERLKHEYNFMRYLWSRGIRSIPKPMWADFESHLGLYEYVQGKKLEPQEIGPQHIDEAIMFYRQINFERLNAEALRLPLASEACFSLAEHLKRVGQRVERLKEISVSSDVEEAADRLVSCELRPFWEEVRARVVSEFAADGGLDECLRQELRCLSPSDFGFHNALVDGSGSFRFVDFEYAGWDDPAKLVCDFANQPDLLLPEELSQRFETAVVGLDSAPDRLARRILWLTPVYQIKWCCIILNHFLPLGHDRALFVNGGNVKEAKKEEQLEKLGEMLSRGKRAFHGACHA